MNIYYFFFFQLKKNNLFRDNVLNIMLSKENKKKGKIKFKFFLYYSI